MTSPARGVGPLALSPWPRRCGAAARARRAHSSPSSWTTLGGSAIGWQIGTSIAVRQGVTVDARVLGGWFDASPRVGFQVGMSADLR